MLKSINNIYEKIKYITIFCTEFYFQNVFFLSANVLFQILQFSGASFKRIWLTVQSGTTSSGFCPLTQPMEPLHSTLEQQQEQNSVAAFQHSSLVAVVGHLLQLRNLHPASVRLREPRMVVVGCRVGGKLWLMVATLVPGQRVHPLEEHVHRLNKGTKLTLQWEHCCCCRIDAAFHLDMLQFLLKFH